MNGRMRLLLGLWATAGGLAHCLSVQVARAERVVVDAQSSLQLYTLQSPYGEPWIWRRRYTQVLGLALLNLTNASEPRAARFAFRSRIRMDSDFGINPNELDPKSDRYVPGLVAAPIDVMYAYLQGDQLLGGYLGFRLGRQYSLGPLGFWSFDGLQVRVDTPAHLAFETFAGFEQRSIIKYLGSGRFEASGVLRGDRNGLEASQFPSYLEERGLAPAYGASVELTDLEWLHAQLSYRKVISRDLVRVSPFAVPDRTPAWIDGPRTSQERLGASLRVGHGRVGYAHGQAVYDFYTNRIISYLASIEGYPSQRLTLGADYDYFLPTFDGDSIFNWFAHSGMSSATARARFGLTPELDLAWSGGVRIYNAEVPTLGTAASDSAAPLSRYWLDELSSFDLRYKLASGSFGLRALLQTGYLGHRSGADATLRTSHQAGHFDTMTVVSLYDWSDPTRAERSATSFSYVLGCGITPRALPVKNARFGLEWEHTMNRLVGQRLRLLLTLNLEVFQ